MANEKSITLNNLKTFKKKADATYAKKTDITSSGLYVGKAGEKSNSATTNGNTYLKLFDNDIKRSQHLINGGGATTVTSNDSGTITVATPIKNLDTTSGSGLGNGRSENIAGSGTIYLHKVAKTGSYNDLVNKPTIPTNIVTIDTEQRISGKKYFENDVNFGKWVNPIRQVSDAPAKLNLMSSAQTSAGFFDTVMFAGAGDWLYLGHLKPDFSIRASFRGTGNENDTYSASLEYTHGTLNTLTDWDYQSGWCVRPTKVSTTTPAIIQIKFTRRLYTDVLRLIITGHNLNDTGSGSAYSGFLDDYTIEVCTNYTNDTWTTVVNRTNANDSIGAGLMYSLQTASYTSCYGIRLKITKCHVTGTGYAFIKISSMQLRDYRPGIKFPDCLGAISQGGGDVWGELYTKSNLVTHNVLPYATNQSYVGTANSQYWSIYSHNFYENGTNIADKYLAKGTSSTNVSQIVYNPVEMKKALIVPSIKGIKSVDSSGNQKYLFELGGTDTPNLVGKGTLTLNRRQTNKWDSVSFSVDAIRYTNEKGVTISYDITNGKTGTILTTGYLERLSPKLFRHTIKIEGYSERTTGTALVCMLQVDSSLSRAINSFVDLATVLGSINKETGEPGVQTSCMVSGGIVVGAGNIDYILPLIRLETDGRVDHTVFVSLINEYPDLNEDVDSHFGHLSDYSTVTYIDSVTPVS